MCVASVVLYCITQAYTKYIKYIYGNGNGSGMHECSCTVLPCKVLIEAQLLKGEHTSRMLIGMRNGSGMHECSCTVWLCKVKDYQ